jgi:hypothetical protein
MLELRQIQISIVNGQIHITKIVGGKIVGRIVTNQP